MGAENYVLLATLGIDPTGTTFLALQSDSDQRVVYKRFGSALTGDQSFLAGFRQEARLMALFDHPNTVAVLDFFSDTETVVVAEYVRGASLRAIVDESGRLTPVQAAVTMKGILQGLAFAHDLGLVHRDIRPENILADAEGVPKLTAFGQTPKILGRSRVREVPGRIAAYMSPERLAGGAVGTQTDIYSCGAVMFKLLTGEAPYDGEDLKAVLRQQIDGEAPDPGLLVRSIPADVAALVVRAMAHDPADRPESADLFLHELETVAESAFGPEWESQGSIKRIVGSAVAELSGSEIGGGPEELGSLPQGRVARLRTYLVLTTLVLVLLLVATSVAASRGLLAVHVEGPSPVTPAAPSVAPSESAAPTPTVAPTLLPSTTPPKAKAPTVAMSFSDLDIWFAACRDQDNCASLADGRAYGSRRFDATGYPVLKLVARFSWSYSANPGDPLGVVANWSAAPTSGDPYAGLTQERFLAPPSGRVDDQVFTYVTATPPKSANAASFLLRWTDVAGDHSVRSPTFQWQR